jgi:hypothetical protein
LHLTVVEEGSSEAYHGLRAAESRALTENLQSRTATRRE